MKNLLKSTFVFSAAITLCFSSVSIAEEDKKTSKTPIGLSEEQKNSMKQIAMDQRAEMHKIKTDKNLSVQEKEFKLKEKRNQLREKMDKILTDEQKSFRDARMKEMKRKLKSSEKKLDN